ncbi:MAG TPA: glycosyltransferase family 39 protein [Candidatus Omnitrophota bacterium]|nr:glycosyltransferase family 39 protein [Candidatus Omnitrophota bacterium]HPB68312.1 glycosyltransferase family 39 protein [Candidatus Omnitrophota bacterium]HQO57797.1 glycosyltransferase family 39 protein [Candidatus Omnitrophota bacterium]HQP11505.1 glycosyltransferase family 39 protein [Candidatus Omnitrophota bacterium]
MKNRLPFHPALIPLFFGGLNLLLRLSVISRGPFNGDCLSLAIQAEKTLQLLQPQYVFGTGYPLTVLLGALFFGLTRLYGNTDPVLAVNLMSVILSSVTVAIHYLVVQKLLDRTAAIASALLLSVFPIFLGISTYGMSHVPSLLFLHLGLLSLLQFKETRSAGSFALSAFWLGCMGASRIQEFALMTVPVSILLGTLVSGEGGSRPGVKTACRRFLSQFFFLWLGAGVTAFLFHLPLFLLSAQNGYFGQLKRYWAASTTPNFLGFLSPALGDSLQVTFFSLTPFGAIAAVLGLLLLLKNNWLTALFLAAWFLWPLLFLGNLAMTTPRFILIALIPLLIFSGAFFSHLKNFPNTRFRLLAGFAFGLIFVTMFVNIHPILRFRHRHELLPGFARFVQKSTEPNAKIICGDEFPFIIYYGRRDMLRRPNDPFRITPADLETFRARLDELLTDGVPVYITSSGLFSYNPGKRFSGFIQSHYRLEYRGETLSEDWHQGVTRLRVGVEKLYRIQKLPPEEP